MTTTSPPDERPPEAAAPCPAVYRDLARSEDFDRLRSSYRRSAGVLTAVFLTVYLSYVLLSSHAPALMATRVAGNVNVALVLGLLQFVTTFLIAWLYTRHANARLDPRADRLRAAFDATTRTGTPHRAGDLENCTCAR
ncbi:DUF485 domain-containing protein [Kitasatospora sp. NPDC088346]|uniref:DUF485 domain-containing protein n=1 Tax=Kitasatospora sp. NPDC088346 TaxID=3364073 RepID=UPI00381C39FE